MLSAPMAGVAGGWLAREACRAGALGLVALGAASDLEAVDKQIDIFREGNHDYPLSIGFIGHAALANDDGWQRYETILQRHRPAVVQFFAPSILQRNDVSNVDLAHEYGAKFLAQVGSVAEAKMALDAGVDGVIAQGSEAGGHGLRRDLGSAMLPLVAAVKALVESRGLTIPVIGAGGIVSGSSLAAVLAVGDGASVGTRLWASRESIGKPKLQAKLVEDNSCDDVIRTNVFDYIENQGATYPWPAPYDSVGSLRNRVSDEYDGEPQKLAAAVTEGSLLADYRAAAKDDDASVVKVLAGEGVGEITSIEPTYDILMRMEQEAIATLQKMSQMVE